MYANIIEKWQQAHSFHFFYYALTNCAIVFDPTTIEAK